MREGVQVTISHPKIIETGIDLLNHASLIFFESGYSLHTLRQASRRSWRIGQRQPVRVFYLHYEETMQSSCLRLMGKKLLVSLAMEGKFSNEGLQGIEDDDDVLTAMARELVTQRGVGESASAVWKAVQEQHARLLPTASALDEELREAPVAEPFGEVVAVDGAAAALVFGARLEKESPRRRPLIVEPDSQLSLF